MSDDLLHQSVDSEIGLSQRYNPEGSQLREVQKRLLEMLLYITGACDSLGIDYYLDGGTLLGAVRHGGFIPWDDDVDIVIDVKNIKKLRNYLIKNPHPRFFYMDRKTEKGYYYGWPKLVDVFSSSEYKGNLREKINQDRYIIHKGISLDIFPYSDHVISWVSKIIHRIHNINLRFILGRSVFFARITSIILFSVCKPMAIFIGTIFSGRETVAHDYLSHNTVHRFLKERVYPLSTVTFEGHQFNAPKDTDYYLSVLYGDYMTLPPESARHHHDLEYKLNSIE